MYINWSCRADLVGGQSPTQFKCKVLSHLMPLQAPLDSYQQKTHPLPIVIRLPLRQCTNNRGTTSQTQSNFFTTPPPPPNPRLFTLFPFDPRDALFFSPYLVFISHRTHLKCLTPSTYLPIYTTQPAVSSGLSVRL